jgi:hypothetical protein
MQGFIEVFSGYFLTFHKQFLEIPDPIDRLLKIGVYPYFVHRVIATSAEKANWQSKYQSG